jgi:DNA-binding transcriptional regulator YiaG
MHDLEAWRIANNLNKTQLADALGATPKSVRDWISRRHIPSWPYMRRIIEATGGAVTADSFYRRAR